MISLFLSTYIYNIPVLITRVKQKSKKRILINQGLIIFFDFFLREESVFTVIWTYYMRIVQVIRKVIRSGAPSETRTRTTKSLKILSLVCLPIPPQGLYHLWISATHIIITDTQNEYRNRNCVHNYQCSVVPKETNPQPTCHT